MTDSRPDTDRAFVEAANLVKAGRLAEAEAAYRRLADEGERRETALQALFDLYVKTGYLEQAADTLIALIGEAPDSLTYHAHLAELAHVLGRPEIAIAHYETMLERNPELADGHFSLGVLFKREFRYRDALRCYERALELGIDRAEEVHSNIGVLYSDMRDGVNAREHYERALALNGDYVPALSNLAGLCEETGDRERAAELYEQVLALDGDNWEALARRAQVHRFGDADDPMFDRIRKAMARTGSDAGAQEGLGFALGRALDQAGLYEEAFDAYKAANALARQRCGPYDGGAAEQGFDQLIGLFDAAWVGRNTTGSDDSPVFVCGMYRSGSTLVEQMLGAHPEITAGGELDFVPWLIARNLFPYPQGAAEAAPADLRGVGDSYMAMSQDLFPDAAHLTDKRPDNFLHLGILKAMFPKARFVHTRRDVRDNCLSLYFQQLGGNLAYANDLQNAEHYHAQHDRLMTHWNGCFGESIFTVDYEELVAEPEPVLRALLEFLGLEWSDDCLAFDRSDGLVKTASIWQVREGLHRKSSGRWRNYAAFIPSWQ